MDAQTDTPLPSANASQEATHKRESFGRSLSRALRRIAPAMVVLATIDAVGTSRVGPPGIGSRILWTLGLLGYLLPWFLLLALIAAALVAGVASLVAWARCHGLPAPSGKQTRRDAWIAVLPMAALYVLLVSSLHAMALRFNNHQLAALLVAVSSLAGLVGLAVGWVAAFAGAQSLRTRLSQRPRLAAAIVWASSLAPVLAVGAWQVRLNWDGFEILGPWMFAGPLAALATLAALWTARRDSLRPPTRFTRIATASALPAAALVSLSLGVAWSDLPIIAVQGKLWSSVIVRGARTITDVDRDGSSSLFGGGDCAPFDPTIHPRARDIPGDGIDSNCLNGDAKPFKPQQPPRWYDDAPALGQAKNFVMITVEALRADHTSLFGYKQRTTPNIDALANKSVIFPRMYSAASATTLSISSLFTTTVPSYTRIRHRKHHIAIDPSMPWIPEMLRAEGFRTGAVLVDYPAFLRNGWDMGYDRGFEHFDTSTHVRIEGGMFYGFPSARLIDKVNHFIDERGKKRFMVWTHLVEPHAAYQRAKGAPDFGDDDPGRYASDIWTVDRQIGRLISHLDEEGLLDETIVMITGDHAEAFGEHGLKYHYSSVFDTQLRTLGLLYVPGLGHREVQQAVIHEDLTTTVMNLLGVKRGFSRLRGRNLVPALRGFRVEPEEIFPELAGFQVRVRSFALVRWPFKLIHRKGTHSYKLFQLENDPGEKRDVASEYPAELATMREHMVQHVEAIGARR